MRVAVLASGEGTNLEALLRHHRAQVVLVLSDRPEAKALERARAAGIPARQLPFARGTDLELAWVAALVEAGTELVCLAGFQKLLGPSFLAAFPRRVLNVHPSLLPELPGLHAVERALGGVRAGCTVHLVDEGVDTGPILAQQAVPIRAGDTVPTLHARIQAGEHQLFPAVLQEVLDGHWDLDAQPPRLSTRGALARLSRASSVVVSACLLGEECRYDGRANPKDPVFQALRGKAVVPVCPEAGAGLGIPRPAVTLVGGTGADVLRGSARAVEQQGGADRTQAFLRGAQLALAAVLQHGAGAAILKERSPSCGSREVWVGEQKRPGAGVTAALLRSRGVAVLSDEEL